MPRLLFPEGCLPQLLRATATLLLFFTALCPPDLARAQSRTSVQSVRIPESASQATTTTLSVTGPVTITTTDLPPAALPPEDPTRILAGPAPLFALPPPPSPELACEMLLPPAGGRMLRTLLFLRRRV